MSAGLDYLGPVGGQLALAFGAGCIAGYGFCMRTIYKLLQTSSDTRHEDCMKRITDLEADKEELKQRLVIVEDRLFSGTVRQLAQLEESGLRILGADKLGGPVE